MAHHNTTTKTMNISEDAIFFNLWQRQLVKDYDHINWSYRLKLVRPQIRVIQVSSFLGQWDPLLREIKISSSLIKDMPWSIVREILKHEMAHQLVSDRIGADSGHGPNFKYFCEVLGVHPLFQKSQAEIDCKNISFETCNRGSTIETDSEEQRLLLRVERLLSLAQSGNENEALSAMEKVTELYEKYNLARRSTVGTHANYDFILVNLGSQKTNAIYPIICSILMEHYFVEVILAHTYEARSNTQIKTIEIFGTVENLKMAEYVFHFLVAKSDELWSSYRQASQADSKYKRSYQLGLLHGFNDKLRTAKKARWQRFPKQEATKSLQILEVDPALTDFIATKHPRLNRKSVKSGRIFSHAFSEGHSEGKAIVVNKGLERQSNAVIKALGFK